MRPHFDRLPAFRRRKGFTVAKNDFSARLAFHCSPLVLERLDELVGEFGVRSREALLRHWIETALAREGTQRGIMAVIEKHHDLLGMNRRRPRSSGSGHRPLASIHRVEREMPEPAPSGEGQAPAAPSTDNPPPSCRPAG